MCCNHLKTIRVNLHRDLEHFPKNESDCFVVGRNEIVEMSSLTARGAPDLRQQGCSLSC